MATITLSIAVLNVADVLDLFDRIKVYRSTTGANGPYAELTAVSTRIVLEVDKIAYEYVDSNGQPTYFYRTSYFNSITTAESSLSDPQQGEGDPALDIISIEELKQNYLFGLELKDEFGNDIPNGVFEYYIKSAASYLEKRLDIPLRPLIVLDERHDFYRPDYYDYIAIQLDHKPVLSVQSVKMVLPSNQQVVSYDPSWIFPAKESGLVRIVPGAGQTAAVALGLTSLWAPLLQHGLDNIPDVFRVDYTAGFEPDSFPFDLKDLVGMTAALSPLMILGDLIFGVGIAGNSVAIDQLMTNVKTTKDAQNSVFGARLAAYKAQIAERIRELRRHYQGIRMVVG